MTTTKTERKMEIEMRWERELPYSPAGWSARWEGQVNWIALPMELPQDASADAQPGLAARLIVTTAEDVRP